MISYTYKKKINKRSRSDITSIISNGRLFLTCDDPIFPSKPKEKWVDVEVPSFTLQILLLKNQLELAVIRELKGRLENYVRNFS